jgi:cytochrome bd ubiquinol oxidase subunit II
MIADLAGHPILPVIWACILDFVILAYVVLDGFDLGVGMLFAVEPELHDRDVMVNTIAPVWDGNETWLVLGGSGLYGAFPAAYSVILPSVYPLVILMLLGLIFRGVAFEFRFRAIENQRHRWDWSFFGGSVLAAFCQGAILGALIQGTKSSADLQFSGGPLDWLTGFTVFCGIAVVFGYALLGSSWLLWRTSGKLHANMRRHTKVLGIIMLALLLVVSLWTPTLNPSFSQRWFAWPGILATAIAPILSVVLAFVFFASLRKEEGEHDRRPFMCALGWFVLGFLGLGYSIFPMIVPPSLDIWQAASVPSSQIFLLVGAAVMIPLILGYNALSYYIFRGKVEPGAHYH